MYNYTTREGERRKCVCVSPFGFYFKTLTLNVKTFVTGTSLSRVITTLLWTYVHIVIANTKCYMHTYSLFSHFRIVLIYCDSRARLQWSRPGFFCCCFFNGTVRIMLSEKLCHVPFFLSSFVNIDSLANPGHVFAIERKILLCLPFPFTRNFRSNKRLLRRFSSKSEWGHNYI